jgi:uncharacterized membrane protein
MDSKPSARSAKRERFASTKAASRKRANSHSQVVILLAVLAMVAVVVGAMVTTRQSRVAVGSGAGEGGLVAATLGHPPYPQIMAEDGAIRLPAADFADGQARHYTYMDGKQPIEFFVVKSRDGVIRAAFNACDVCFLSKKGYVQQGDVMVCVNCGRRFATELINVEVGGCNPAPLPLQIVEVEGTEHVVMSIADVIDGARFF